MASTFVSGLGSRPIHPVAMRCVLVQDPLLSRCFSLPRYLIGFHRGVTRDGLAFHPERSRNSPSYFILGEPG